MMGILHVARITDADDDNSAHIADTSEDIDLAAPHASPQHHCRPHPYHEKTDGKLLHVAIILFIFDVEYVYYWGLLLGIVYMNIFEVVGVCLLL